jgi:hypothetical protein
MRSLTTFLGFFLAVSAVALAQPAVKVTPTALDFGSVGPRRVDTSITISNVGTDTLHVIGVAASCGCTAAKIDQRAIAPGASVRVPVTVDGRHKTGAVHTQLTVASDDPALPALSIQVRGVIMRPLDAPEFVAPTADIVVGSSQEVLVQVKNTSPSPVRIDRPVLSDIDGLEAVVSTRSLDIPAGETRAVRVTLTPKRPGPASGMLSFATTDALQSTLDVGLYTNASAAKATATSTSAKGSSGRSSR